MAASRGRLEQRTKYRRKGMFGTWTYAHVAFLKTTTITTIIQRAIKRIRWDTENIVAQQIKTHNEIQSFLPRPNVHFLPERNMDSILLAPSK